MSSCQRVPTFRLPLQSVEELANAGIKMAEINKLKEASIATVGAVLATPTKVHLLRSSWW